ncbi:MAG: hypothetical protein GY795_17145 [Desulfobacterales bacterium]|nr:hypothetical protein [Desulfobacterales bacterium]
MCIKTDNKAEEISATKKQRAEVIESVTDVIWLILVLVFVLACLVFPAEWDGFIFILLGLPMLGRFLPSLHRKKEMMLVGCLSIVIFLWITVLVIINQTTCHRHGYNSRANADIKNAYTAAQAYFTDFPSIEVNAGILRESGFRSREDVRLVIQSGFQDTLAMTTSHAKGEKIYSINWAGEITAEYKNGNSEKP